MNKSNFTSEQSYINYASYIEKVKRIISVLPDEDALELMKELDSHIFESLHADTSIIISEEERIKTVLDKLGSPESYLAPLIAEKRLTHAIKKYNLVEILKAIFGIFKTGGQYFLLSILYLFTLGFGIVIIAKIFYPQKTGFFFEEGQIIGLGFFSKINAQATDLLGYWIIPLMIILIIIFYLITTYLLRKIVLRKRK